MKISEFEEKKKFSEASGSIAVADSNIEMMINDLGLYEERVIDSKIDISEQIKFVSPNFNTYTNESEVANRLYHQIDNISFDERLGYYQSLYVGYVAEGDYRENASSGGMGTWIFKELFDQNLIDYVIHVKQNKNTDNDDRLFKYDISSSVDEIKKGAKTRYYPVEISEVMKRVKENPGRYAIIGIPSFIYSVRLLAEQDEVISERIKYTVGLVCGHQKSTKFSESMAFQVGIQPGDLLEIDFRHKLLDRPASRYAVKMTGIIDGKEETIIKPTSELFGQNWGWGFFKPTASNFTDDVFNETADIVLGDAWLPKYTPDSKGNNIIIIRNTEIADLVDNAIKEKRLKMDKVDNETIFASQASHYRHTHDELAYRLYKRDANNEWRPKKRVEATDENITDTRKKIQDLRRTISNQSHFQYQEAVRKGDFNYFVESMTKYTKEYTDLYKRINRANQLKTILSMKPGEIINKVIKKIKK